MVMKKRIQQLEEGGEHCAALCLRQILCCQRALDDGLAGAPVEQVVEQHAEEQKYHGIIGGRAFAD